MIRVGARVAARNIPGWRDVPAVVAPRVTRHTSSRNSATPQTLGPDCRNNLRSSVEEEKDHLANSAHLQDDAAAPPRQTKKTLPKQGFCLMAERERFELSIPVKVYALSRGAPSASSATSPRVAGQGCRPAITTAALPGTREILDRSCGPFLSSENASMHSGFANVVPEAGQWPEIASYSHDCAPLPALLFPRKNQRNVGPGVGPGE